MVDRPVLLLPMSLSSSTPNMFDGVVEWLAGLVVALMGAIMGHQHVRINKLEERVDAIPDKYATREDVKERFDLIIDHLVRIEDKVERK